MMAIDVTRIGELPGLPAATPSPKPTTDGSAFGAVLNDSIQEVNRLQHAADASIRDMATGGATSLHDTMIALEKAETSFKLMMQVRNKIVEAYHEVLRMQV